MYCFLFRDHLYLIGAFKNISYGSAHSDSGAPALQGWLSP